MCSCGDIVVTDSLLTVKTAKAMIVYLKMV